MTQNITNIVLANRYEIPLLKRLFDIFVSGTALFFLSPLFLIIGLLIKYYSKGPVFYKSKRVGANFTIFDFYKFRSMDVNADSKIKDLKNLNQYTNPNEKELSLFKEKLKNNECSCGTSSCEKQLITSEGSVCETTYKTVKKLEQEGQTFVKIANDPRVFKFGAFLRNSSLDELPQLINVLKGDMSIVGNRPLPLYEAEQLTTDSAATRFLGPAGITGLWQVTKRGKGGAMSAEERISLDNSYAKSYSIFFDFKIMFMTIPALFQKENV